MKKYLFVILGLIILRAFIPVDYQRSLAQNLQQKAPAFGTFTDNRDGITYKWVKIGTQVWMAESLKATKFNDGKAIPNVTGDKVWFNLNIGAYCWYNNSKVIYGNTYGALYNWFAVRSGKLCPVGWHVPSDTDWNTLESYLISNGYNYDGTKTDNKIAKSMAATTKWKISIVKGAIGNNLAANNKSGFTALPGGVRTPPNVFGVIGINSIWWTSTKHSSGDAICAVLSFNESYFSVARAVYKQNGYSVRCVKDDPLTK